MHVCVHPLPVHLAANLRLLLFVGAALSGCVRAEIAQSTDISGVLTNAIDRRSDVDLPPAVAVGRERGQGRCSLRKIMATLNAIDDVEDLKLGVPVNIAFDNLQKKRFLLYLNTSTPLTISFSQNVGRKIYFNETTNLQRALRPDQRTVMLPCALPGQYDLFVQAKKRGSVKIEANAFQPQTQFWPLLNRTNRVTIRHQNRVRKRQMIVKWNKSEFDHHVVQYCLVINTQRSHKHFCNAANEYFQHSFATRNRGACFPGSMMDYVWRRRPERRRTIDPHFTNIVCSGSRTQQILNGLLPNQYYYLDLFGVHTRRQNLTFHIASTRVSYNRTHPSPLRPNTLTVAKITAMHGVQVYSFKVPFSSAVEDNLQSAVTQLRYLILPCGGSEVDAKILKQRNLVGEAVRGIYRPTYIRIPGVYEGERYIIRFTPSNEDEKLRANKVALAVTTTRYFMHLPELPPNITVFEVRTHCQSSTIAWYSSPEVRTMSYCVIVFNLPQRNRSSIDYTNYCMDFGKGIMQHRLFRSIKCLEKDRNLSTIERHTILNLTPGESYLIYVTANLSVGKPLPYQSLKIKTSSQCHNEIDSREVSYY